ncbi:hypothetical protein CFC21_008483 [Triticum aestivum]|uniref:BTB domain-containing protein n=2 Tax=Triticum aestivum TaxID=4565 RepID=A0A9R1DGC9_WHEAT|nr:hypothetical protein CFC21_008483 [Triticum aestivum]
MSFAGGKLCPSRSVINDAGAASGYHLFVVEGYSRSKDMGDIKSRRFRVGGHLWFLEYWPSCCRTDGSAISDAIRLHQDVAGPVKAQFRFSFIDQPDKHKSKYKPYFPGKYGMSFSDLLERDDLEQSKHVEDDGFTIRCDIIVEDVIDAGAEGTGTASPFITVPPPDMQQHFTDLLAAKEGIDVKFEVGGEIFNAHRCILAARSRVFKAELLGPMKEGTATADAIHVEDVEAPAFRAMLKFIYSDLEPEMEKEDGEDPVWQWQNLLVAADRYDLQRLKLMCEDKLCGFVDVSTTPSILALAERHCCDGLKTACYNFLGASGNLRAVAASDGFDDLITSCPFVMKELINMFMA